MTITVTGLNHKSAPVEVREKLAVPPEALAEELAAARDAMNVPEAVVVSTCNRVELYLSREGPAPDVADFLAKRHRIPLSDLQPHLYHHEDLAAARHLFRVTAGLDSQVLGETQIQKQVKDAYQAAHAARATGRVLNRLFQTALAVAKRVRTETGIQEKSVSMSSVAANMAAKVFSDLPRKTVLILGAGDTGRVTLEAFRDRGVERILVVNRTVEKAQELSKRAYPLETLPRVLPQADILISCIHHDGYAVDAPTVKAALHLRREEPMVLLDLGVPRNIDPEAGNLENVFLFDVDGLQGITRENLRAREVEMRACEPIIDEAARAVIRKLNEVR